MARSMDPENYQLTRNDFELCAKNAFKNLLGEQEFSDVTLACKNNKQVKAHKVILGACSPFFREILLKNPHQHPLIYLKGIGIDDLEAIIKFIYQGQTSISETNLDSFLASAQELQVEGLLLAKSEAAQKSVERQQIEPKAEMPQLVENIDQPEELETIANYLKNSKVLPSNSNPKKVIPPPVPTVISQPTVNKFKCDACDFESLYRKSLKRHKENVHQQEVVQQAEPLESMDTREQLLVEDTSNKPLERNKVEKTDVINVDQSKGNFETVFQDDLYKCDKCDFTTKHKWNIKRHVDRVHQPESPQKNPEESNECESIEQDLFVSDSSLNSEDSFSSAVNEPPLPKPTSYVESVDDSHPVLNDVEPKFEDSKHHCDHCDFATTHKKNLKRHVLRLHGNVDSEEKSDDSVAVTAPKREKLTENNVSSKFLDSSSGDNASAGSSFTYTCDKCDFTSDNKWNLTRHILRVHKEMKYPCDYCDYKAPQTYRLKEHMQKKHR